MASIKSAFFQALCFCTICEVWCNNLTKRMCIIDQLEPPFVCNTTLLSSDNVITHLDSEVIELTSNYSYHVELLFTDVKMDHFPKGLGNMFPLTDMILAVHCGLKSLRKEDLEKLDLVTVLSFQGNEIEELPDDVLEPLTNLEVFIISENRIKVLPESLIMTNVLLIVFIADDIMIEELPEKLFANNPDIAIISFKNGALKSIKVDFTNLQQLDAVALNNNTCVDASFDKIDDQVAEFQEMLKEKC